MASVLCGGEAEGRGGLCEELSDWEEAEAPAASERGGAEEKEGFMRGDVADGD